MNRPAPILADYLAAASAITAINPKHQRTVIDWVKAQRRVDFHVDSAEWAADQDTAAMNAKQKTHRRHEEKWHDKALELESYMPRRELENATKQMLSATEACDTVYWADQTDDVSEPDVEELRGSLPEPADENERYEDAVVRYFLNSCQQVAEARVRAECTNDVSDSLMVSIYLSALSAEAVAHCDGMGDETAAEQRCISYRDHWLAKCSRAAESALAELTRH